jgi:hypothetical protein
MLTLHLLFVSCCCNHLYAIGAFNLAGRGLWLQYFAFFKELLVLCFIGLPVGFCPVPIADHERFDAGTDPDPDPTFCLMPFRIRFWILAWTNPIYISGHNMTATWHFKLFYEICTYVLINNELDHFLQVLKKKKCSDFFCQRLDPDRQALNNADPTRPDPDPQNRFCSPCSVPIAVISLRR